MRIVIKKVGQEPEVKEIENELHILQDIVGGCIQCVNIGIDDAVCVCNEEGKLLNLKPNFILNEDIIAGDVFFCSAGYDDFESLNDDQIELLMNIMNMLHISDQKEKLN